MSFLENHWCGLDGRILEIEHAAEQKEVVLHASRTWSHQNWHLQLHACTCPSHAQNDDGHTQTDTTQITTAMRERKSQPHANV